MATRSAVVFAFVLLSACAGGAPSAGTADTARRRAPSSSGAADAPPPSLAAAELARIPRVTYGPYLGMGRAGALVVWAEETGAERKFSAVQLSAEGRPLGAARAVGAAPDEIGVVALRPIEGGYALAYTRRGPNAESLELACLGPDGAFRGAPAVLGPLPGRGMWIDAVAHEGGVLVLAAGRVEDGKRRAEIVAAPVDSKCRAGERVTLVKDAQAWQVVALGSSPVLALVRDGAGGKPSVEAWVLEASGKPRSTTVVSSAPASLDLDAMAIGERAILAWTEERALEPRIRSAVVGADGKVAVEPRPLTPPEGEQTLIRLVPPLGAGERGVAVWENLSASRGAARKLEVSAFYLDGRLSGPRARLEYASDDGGVPELAATAKGLAALTLAPACRRGARCDAGALAPLFVELDAGLVALAAEPLRLAPLSGKTAELAFGLGCTVHGCLSMAALSRVPAPVFAVELESRSDAWRSPASLVDTTVTPRVLEHEALSRVDSVAAFALERVADAEVLATITDFDPTTPWQRLKKPAPDGRFEPLRARVALERLGVGGEPAAELKASPISLRAHSLGKVALAPGDPARGELLVVWSGLDAGEPQVFLTLLTRGGDRVGQRMLTRKKGDLGDIVASWAGDGFVVAWVDERSGDPEVYATKVDARLNRVAPEQRITDAPGAATDLALVADGARVRLAWSDARGAELPGHADVYTALLRAKDAAREGGETRLAATRAHSFSAVLAPFQGGFAAAWVERPEEGGEPGSLALVRIGADGAASPLVPLSVADGEPRSVALACTEVTCRLAAVIERADAADLAVGAWAGAGAPELSRVLGLAGNNGASVTPLIRGDSVFFADADARSARIRRARLAW